jgi:hypothetical protein
MKLELCSKCFAHKCDDKNINCFLTEIIKLDPDCKISQIGSLTFQNELSKSEIARLKEENEKLRDEISHRDVFVKLSEESNHLQKIALLAVVEKENERLKAENERLKAASDSSASYCQICRKTPDSPENCIDGVCVQCRRKGCLSLSEICSIVDRSREEANKKLRASQSPHPEHCAVSGAKLDTHKPHKCRMCGITWSRILSCSCGDNN